MEYPAINALNDFGTILFSGENRAYFSHIDKKFGTNLRNGIPAWEEDDVPDGVYRSDGWNLICDYTRNIECMICTSRLDRIWIFESGDTLRHALDNSSGFEFHVFDRGANFLLAHNMDDYLIGWGESEKWVRGFGQWGP
ncbi:hypothetical protein [Sphingopyxis sp. KK2]|uniref:hypothetical protein n=1 Tax=Sphingopyxis sp. KK2 TaxID=1855727 RepID=UPI001181ABEB|nr:hypothetical protein [Sphingopyxis sp. KK2]